MNIKNIVVFSKILLVIFLASSCNEDDNSNNCIRGEGNIITSSLNVSDFNGIGLTISADVNIKQGNVVSVQATGHENIIADIRTFVSNNFWNIGLEEDCYSNYQLSIDITVPDINKIDISGSGNIVVEDFTNQNDLDIDVSGSGNLTLNSFEGANDFNVDVSGSGTINAEKDISSVQNLDIDISGSGEYSGFRISGADCEVGVSGSGIVRLTAINTLDVTINGSGTVFYKGNPTITQNISGAGSLIDAN